MGQCSLPAPGGSKSSRHAQLCWIFYSSRIINQSINHRFNLFLCMNKESSERTGLWMSIEGCICAMWTWNRTWSCKDREGHAWMCVYMNREEPALSLGYAEGSYQGVYAHAHILGTFTIRINYPQCLCTAHTRTSTHHWRNPAPTPIPRYFFPHARTSYTQNEWWSSFPAVDWTHISTQLESRQWSVSS